MTTTIDTPTTESDIRARARQLGRPEIQALGQSPELAALGLRSAATRLCLHRALHYKHDRIGAQCARTMDAVAGRLAELCADRAAELHPEICENPQCSSSLRYEDRVARLRPYLRYDYPSCFGLYRCAFIRSLETPVGLPGLLHDPLHEIMTADPSLSPHWSRLRAVLDRALHLGEIDPALWEPVTEEIARFVCACR